MFKRLFGGLDLYPPSRFYDSPCAVVALQVLAVALAVAVACGFLIAHYI